jgi:hypothetical protein
MKNHIQANTNQATIDGEMQEIFMSLIQIQSALIKSFGSEEAKTLINSSLTQALSLE